MAVILTLKATNKIVTDNIHISFYYFSEKIKLDILLTKLDTDYSHEMSTSFYLKNDKIF